MVVDCAPSCERVNVIRKNDFDIDLRNVSATLVDMPGATPSQLVLALGKDSKAYLLNRNNLGGIAKPLAFASLPTAVRGQSAASYHTGLGHILLFIPRITPLRLTSLLPQARQRSYLLKI